MILYFSGTGNSRYAAEYIGNITQDEVVDLGVSIKEGKSGARFASVKPFVVVCPVYGWRIPRIINEFLRNSTFEGSQEIYFVITCGTDIGDAEHHVRELCREKGLLLKGTLPVVMPENYIAMFNAPDEDEAEKIIKEADGKIAEIASKIKCGSTFPYGSISVIDRLKSGIVNSAFYALFVKAKGFRTEAGCTGCGKCAQLCPLNNIRIENGRPIWGDECTHCMACICRCPEEAIEYNRASIGKPRYVNRKTPPKGE